MYALLSLLVRKPAASTAFKPKLDSDEENNNEKELTDVSKEPEVNKEDINEELLRFFSDVIVSSAAQELKIPNEDEKMADAHCF